MEIFSRVNVQSVLLSSSISFVSFVCLLVGFSFCRCCFVSSCRSMGEREERQGGEEGVDGSLIRISPIHSSVSFSMFRCGWPLPPIPNGIIETSCSYLDYFCFK